MIYPSLKEFGKLAKKGNLVPVYREIVADFDTPVSAFLKLGQRDYSFLLESVEGGEKIARYSFLGADPGLVFTASRDSYEVLENGRRKTFPLMGKDALEVFYSDYMKKYKPVPVSGIPRFHGGAVGFVGYDYVRTSDGIPLKNNNPANAPEMVFMLTDTILIFDHIKHIIKIVANAHIEGSHEAAYKKACARIDKMRGLLLSGKVKKSSSPGRAPKKIKFTPNMTGSAFREMVRKTKEFIFAGDIIQAVLSRRFSAPVKDVDSFDIYRALRMINPSPYMYYLNLKAGKIIGSSPELLVRVEDGVIDTRPIAGTRKRGKDEEEEKKLEKDLLSDPKEIAEHIMLVDLGRNDIGRVSGYGRVKVTEFMQVEKYSHVMHIVSNVRGRLKPGISPVKAFSSCFPAGTVSGAPKIRAMQIISGLEPDNRGVYAGAVGYFSYSGNLDTCITIRTIVVKDGIAYIQVGAGIVADSVPENELVETENKVKGMIKAVELAGEGLDI